MYVPLGLANYARRLTSGAKPKQGEYHLDTIDLALFLASLFISPI